jgi:hypothetical protein
MSEIESFGRVRTGSFKKRMRKRRNLSVSDCSFIKTRAKSLWVQRFTRRPICVGSEAEELKVLFMVSD